MFVKQFTAASVFPQRSTDVNNYVLLYYLITAQNLDSADGTKVDEGLLHIKLCD